MIRGLQAVEDEASLKEREYERALTDYRRLMRHRVANPLAALRGGVQSLRELPNLGHEEQQTLLENVYEATRRLENVAFDPSPLSGEEKPFGGRPQLRREVRTGGILERENGEA
jgi:signal transduction histidine kinase